MSITRVFLGTQAPLPQLAAERLLSGQSGLPDLGNIIIAVPGSFAREKLEYLLAGIAGNGLLSPQLMTPGVLLHLGTKKSNIPSALEDELIWNQVANKAANSGKYKLLFPHYNGSSAVSGTSFHRLRLELAAGGVSIADAGDILGTRAEELQAIETLYLEELENLGFSDRLQSDKDAADDCAVFESFDKIILCGLCDIPHLLKKRMMNAAEMFPGKIEAWIHADECDAVLFDETGASVPEKWIEHAVDIPDFDDRTFNAENIDDAADILVGILKKNPKLSFDDTAIVLTDNMFFKPFKRKLSQWAEECGSKLDLYLPSGIEASNLRLHKLGAALLAFLKSPEDIDTAILLIKNPDFIEWIAEKMKHPTSAICKKLDEFMLEVLPAEIQNAESYFEKNSHHTTIKQLLDILSEIKKQYEELPLAQFLREFFTEVFRHRSSIDSSLYMDVPFSAECNLFKSGIDTLERINQNTVSDKTQLFELLWQQLGNEPLAQIPGENSLAVQGRLELPFMDEKNIIICGVNAGLFPDRITQTVFLTDSMRRKTGIRCNQDTFARAATHLNAVCKSSVGRADVWLISVKRSCDGSPMFPSPLLFSGKQNADVLVKRAKYFFKESDAYIPKKNTKQPEHGIKFTLSPVLTFRSHPEHPDVPVLSVTDFSTYLYNPLDFFLERIMKMEKLDYASREPDAKTFGTILHETIQALDNNICHSTEEYQEKLKAALNGVIIQKYGKNPSPLIGVVKENIAQRLEYAAEYLLKCSRDDKFIPIETEYTLGGEEQMIPYIPEGSNEPLVFLKGKIDRIEYNPIEKKLRIVDFKTGKKSSISDIVKALRNASYDAMNDLQMPLYAHFLRNDRHFQERHPDIDMKNVPISCAYLILPKAVTDTCFEECSSFDLDGAIDTALLKMTDIVKQIKLWNTNSMSAEGMKNSRYASLFLPDLQSCLTGINWLED